MVRTRTRFRKALPKIIEQYPTSGFVFLTLTVKNCLPTDLRATLKAMNTAWKRLVEYTEFRKVSGWIRLTQITKADNGMAHPHFHCLLMVPSSWLSGKGDYVTTADWRNSWGKALRVDYLPEVKSGGFRTRDGDNIAKILNYIAKNPSVPEPIDPDWLFALTDQTHHLRLFADSGTLKNVLRSADGKISKPQPVTDTTLLTWDHNERRYNILDNI
jgi:hypothetical protein